MIENTQAIYEVIGLFCTFLFVYVAGVNSSNALIRNGSFGIAFHFALFTVISYFYF